MTNEQIHARANAYADEVAKEAAAIGRGGFACPLDKYDVAKAFVIGFAAGVENARGVRGVRK